MSEEIKPTVLYEEHVNAGARMIDFGPWILPVQYTSIVEEHVATRNCAGLFDTCHMGEIGFAGPGSLPTLERIFTRNVEKIPPGSARYGFLTTEEGTVVDDCVLYVLPDEFSPPSFILCINAGDISGDLEWIREHAEKDTVIEDLSNVTGKIDLQGPESDWILNKLVNREIKLNRFGFKFVKIGEISVLLSRSGYTGENGYELFTLGRGVIRLWKALLSLGRERGIVPAGLGARDTLRTESCFPLYGHELSRDITPVEAGFEWALSFDKDFLGREVLLKQKEEGPARCIVPFKMKGRAPARSGYPVFAGGKQIGVVTSGTYLPSLKCPGGMCIISSEFGREGQAVEIEIRRCHHEAVIVSRPLFKGGQNE